MGKKKPGLTKADLLKVKGLPSRQAGEILGYDKATVNRARRKHAEAGAVIVSKGLVPDSTLVGNETDAESFHEVWKGSEGVITVVIHEEMTHDAILRKFGHDPEKVSIAGVLEETHWQYNGIDWNHRYKFKTTRTVAEGASVIDPVGVLSEMRRRSGLPYVPENAPLLHEAEGAFVLSINDIQLGQSYNGGSVATIANFYNYIELAKQRIAELRYLGRDLDKLVIIGGGDLVEGCVIYPNQSFSLDLNRKQQIEGVVGLILHALDELAPLFRDVEVLAARGNHGENRINGKYTTMDDNDDTHVFEMAKLALDRDPSMQHIKWTIAGSESGVAIKVFDWVLATTHGDVYAKGVTGATVDKKAHNWMKNMALGREKFGLLGQADVLITHHFHHDKMSDWGSCLWRQTPSQDRGSPYFEHATGEYSVPGMLTFVMTEESRYQDEAVLR